MKRIFTFFTLILAAVSCEHFLDEKPVTDFTREDTETTELKSAYSSLEDAVSELNGGYANFKADIYEMNSFLVGDVMSDNCYVGGDGVAEEQFDNMKLTANNTQVSIMWQQYYTLTGIATNVIENLKLMPDNPDETAERNRIMAEAGFIRAWALFDIVRLWGDAPLTLELIPSITAENIDKWYPIMYPARTSEDDIYDQILEDLSDENIAHLESISHGAFQATKGAAYGLRAKVYATRGAKSERDYNAVIAECDKVAGEGYSLVSDFDDLWTVEGKFSSEGIFELHFSSAAEQHNWAYWVLLTEVSGEVSVTWRRYCTPTQQLIAKFDKENDSRYASSIYWGSVPYNTYYPASNYPLAYKIRQKDNNIILMRYADILLLKAEALVEVDRQDEAIDIVNAIRGRAGIQSLDRNMSKESARLAVENERQLELLLEGHRWYDLVRNERMETVMAEATDKNGIPMIADVSSFRRKLPVPQDQIDINERLIQNEGY
ncbi:MAG: RagB/SusD family nutrient uptake outer membrane protein [Bacteroidales bacterium]|nr:RagB/SusD family nutrient uptake outer membrane protein [Bacteroidales bacterium]